MVTKFAYNKSRSSKTFGNLFRTVTSVHYQAISHTEYQNLQFLLRSTMLQKKYLKADHRSLQSEANSMAKSLYSR